MDSIKNLFVKNKTTYTAEEFARIFDLQNKEDIKSILIEIFSNNLLKDVANE